MKVSELIGLLSAFHPDTAVVIELDDDYHHITEVDSVALVDPESKHPVWNFVSDEDGGAPQNAIRICV